jgi:hypothetical protein
MNKYLRGENPNGSVDDAGCHRVGRECEGPPLSPDCVPGLDMVLRAEARKVDRKRSCQARTLPARNRRGILRLYWATPALLQEFARQTTIAWMLGVVGVRWEIRSRRRKP